MHRVTMNEGYRLLDDYYNSEVFETTDGRWDASWGRQQLPPTLQQLLLYRKYKTETIRPICINGVFVQSACPPPVITTYAMNV